MDISITHFKSIFDNKTNKVSQFKDFQDFRSALYHLAQQPRANKKDATLISPAYYVDNTTRANDNVIGWSKWCAVDIDDHDFKGDLLLGVLFASLKWNSISLFESSGILVFMAGTI